MYDVIIIGAGITGCFLAHDLSKYESRVLVLEKEADIANKASMANSAIIHSGHDPLEGTLKARLNVRGNEMYEDICRKLGVSFKRTSAFVAATSKEEEGELDMLYKRALDRHIPVSRLTREEAVEKEPNLSDQVTQVIELPTTGIIYPWETAIALAEEAVENGVEFHLEEMVSGIDKQKEGFLVKTNKGAYEALCIINAAGTAADKIYGMVSKREDFRITPRRGEYFVLDKLKEPLVSRVIYPVPSKAGKGVLVVPTTHGNILLGPNSQLVEGEEENNTTAKSLAYVREQVSKTVKNIPFDKVIRTFAGLRPTSTAHDFVIAEAEDVPGFVNAAGIESPGLASAPAVSEYIMENIMPGILKLAEKQDYKKRRPNIRLAGMTIEEKNKLVKENPAFGRIVCRCEQITEGEIVDAIHRPLGARTVKGVKKRARPGMGRCQGGFCEPLVVAILARELQVQPNAVRLDGERSTMLVEETKE